MSKRDRSRTSFSGGARPAPQPGRSAPPAPSRAYPDLDYRRDVDLVDERNGPPAPIPRRSYRRDVTTPPTRRKALKPALSAFSWGTWTLPPPLSVQRALARSTTQDRISADICARRTQRREVIFATRSNGKGSFSRKRHYSNRRCK